MIEQRQKHALNPPVKSMNFLFSVLITITLIGCATSSTGPLSAGADMFVVSRQAGAFPRGREPLLAEALTEANTKCSALGKTMKLVSATENTGPYILGNYPKVTVIFSCT
jgi:hypothetical protein